MKITSKTKPRVVNYVSPSELAALKTHARSIGLRTPSQIVGLWMRQKLAMPAAIKKAYVTGAPSQ